MKDRFDRLKQFVSDHRTACAYVAGTTTGVFVTSYLVLKYPTPALGPKHLSVNLNQTPEQVFEVMKRSGGFTVHNVATKQSLHVATQDFIEKM